MSITIYYKSEDILLNPPKPGEMFIYQVDNTKDTSSEFTWMAADTRESAGVLEVCDVAGFVRRTDALTFAMAFRQKGWFFSPALLNAAKKVADAWIDNKDLNLPIRSLSQALKDTHEETRVLIALDGDDVLTAADPGVDVKCVDISQFDKVITREDFEAAGLTGYEDLVQNLNIDIKAMHVA